MFSKTTMAENRRALDQGSPLVFVQSDGAVIWAGPKVQPHGPCMACMRSRFTTALPQVIRRQIYDTELMTEHAFESQILSFHKPMLDLLIHKLSTGEESEEGTATVYKLDLASMKVTPIKLLRAYNCAVCADQEPTRVRMSLSSRPKPDPSDYRTRPLDPWPNYRKTFVGSDLGILQMEKIELSNPVTALVLSGLSDDGGQPISGAGQETSFEKSGAVAVLEGLERYVGLKPRDPIETLFAAFENIADKALDPARCGLPENSQAPLKPYSPSTPYHWIQAYSFERDEPIWVPRQMAFYDLKANPDEPFLYGNSNGCAGGASVEEALFHGLLELIERDHFMLSWYGRCPLTRIDSHAIADQEVGFLLDRADVLGYQIHLFAMKFDQPVAAVMAVAERRNGGFGRLVFAAGCHPDPVRAVAAALKEALTYTSTVISTYEPYENDLREKMNDFNRVQKLSDHQGLWCLPQMKQWADFLLCNPINRQARRLETLFPKEVFPTHSDLADDLRFLIKAIQEAGHDVIAVNQTSGDLRQAHFAVVAAIIPGFLPMTFGRMQRRLKGLHRLRHLPQRFGYVDHPIDSAHINPIPHPFP